MERLTFEGNFCDIAQCRELPCPYNGACSQRKVWERLKAYEGTECEPEQIVKAKDALEYAYGNADRIIELAEADKAGRLVVHARWLDAPWLYYGAKQYVCSRCRDDGYWRKRELHFKETYCPNCGAKMDGGDDNEAD